ncbi:MAG: hypothetical protein LKE48_03320 [Solobacterium sp.]|jgi:hypothetical protein|nr:hypothetical protein [Solobacterium sp.]MCH4281535.1 hypothetical protein [Solobacterium sp.]
MRLIDADDLLATNYLADKDKYEKSGHINRDAMNEMMLYEFKMMVDDAPTIEAAPVVHAHWETYSNPYAFTPGGCPYVRCSHCHGYGSMHLGGPEGYRWDYCPCCGAKMDEKR